MRADLGQALADRDREIHVHEAHTDRRREARGIDLDDVGLYRLDREVEVTHDALEDHERVLREAGAKALGRTVLDVDVELIGHEPFERVDADVPALLAEVAKHPAGDDGGRAAEAADLEDGARQVDTVADRSEIVVEPRRGKLWRQRPSSQVQRHGDHATQSCSQHRGGTIGPAPTAHKSA